MLSAGKDHNGPNRGLWQKGIMMSYQETPAKNGWATGLSYLAAAVLLIVGILDVLQGIAAINADDLFVVGPQYIYQFNLTTWGWIHLVLGLIITLTGVMLFFGGTVSRVVAIAFLSLSIIANFLWIPYYPWWSITLIVLAIIGIWAVAARETE